MVTGAGFSCHRGIKLTLSTTAKELRKTLLREKSTFVVPGGCFWMSRQIGTGYRNSVGVLREVLWSFRDFRGEYR